jgi:hypothetical protein
MAKPKIHKVPAEAIGYAKNWVSIVEAATEANIKLAEDFKARQGLIQDTLRLELRAVWRQLAIACDLPPEETWDNPQWGLDLSYIEFGDAFIIEREPPQNPLAALFGSEPEDATVKPEPKLDRNKMN